MARSIIAAGQSANQLAEIDWAVVQLAQFKHDENYHREISRLPMQDRLRHMVLHFAKYVGRMQEAHDQAVFRQIAVDVLIIALSCANILNIDLCKTSLVPGQQPMTRAEFVRLVAISAGRMAAACEKLDHLEDFPFRPALAEEALAILQASLALCAAEGWDPIVEMQQRLLPIKRKSIFHGSL